jgi:tetratricopeptide (TPR) repeat protein
MPDTLDLPSEATMSSSRANDAISDSRQALIAALERAAQARAENDNASAFAYYARATELDPNQVEAWEGRAATSSQLDDALLSWTYACALAPENSTFTASLQERLDEKIAITTIEQKVSLLSLSRAMAEVGQKSPAYRLVKRATELDDKDPEAWLWRAGLAADGKESIACLKRVLALDPGNARARAGLQWTRAPHSPSQAPLSSAGQAATELVTSGRDLLLKGSKARAYEMFEQATTMDPTSVDAWLWRASATTGVDEALMCIEKALALNPENRSALEARSWLRVKKLRDTMQSHAKAPNAPRKEPAPTRTPLARVETHTLRNGLIVVLLILVVVLAAFIYLLLRLAT